MTATTQILLPPLDFFPMAEIREKQKSALEFIERARAKSFRDIVISAPTGLGKSGIGAAVCFWAAQKAHQFVEDMAPGGYYLVTQKLLQDQLAADVREFVAHLRSMASLKSAVEYECPQYGDCMSGKQMKNERMCPLIREVRCKYQRAKIEFGRASLSVTNYPYFFSERTYVQMFKKRPVLIADECHSLESQLLGFVELTVSEATVEKFTPALQLPVLNTLGKFRKWVSDAYLPPLLARLSMLRERAAVSDGNRQVLGELNALENYCARCQKSVSEIEQEPENWVYWQEKDNKDRLASIAKPINAAPFMKELIQDAADMRIYMSAYPGPKRAFCRSLGLDPDEVAFASYRSTFDPERRPIHMTMVGSMGRQFADETTPLLLRQIVRIANEHRDEKGVIHTHSYKLGKTVYEHLLNEGLGDRVLFPDNSRDRTAAFEAHSLSSTPSIMISPSMTEGFNLIGDLARWQIIAKVPYPYLGDEQVRAKKDLDPDWYVLQTCMTIIQACGRVMRSHDDHGVTYILDRDFKRLYTKNSHFFPAWFTEAFHWYD